MSMIPRGAQPEPTAFWVDKYISSEMIAEVECYKL